MALQQAILNQESMRNFREFLEMYNRTTESCFKHCIVNLHMRDVTPEENQCLNDCTSKTARLNHRVLSAFMVEQPKIVQQKVETVQRETEAAMKALEAQGISAENLSPEEMAQRVLQGMAAPSSQPTKH